VAERAPAALVWVIIVNWNGREDTLTCLDSLERSTLPPARVIVVDNGSTDGSVPAIRERYPEVEILETGENLGFGRANNLGAERFLADPDATHLLLLNNDATVGRETLDRLVQAIEKDRRIGAAVPKIYYTDTPGRLWYAGGSIDWKRGSVRHRGKGEIDRGQFDNCKPVSFAPGCALLLKREAVEKVGLFDPRYFFQGEDVDLSLRLTRAGYTILYCPQVTVFHKVGSSRQRRNQTFTYYHMVRNRLLTMSKHATWSQWTKFVLFFPLLWGWKALEAAIYAGDPGAWKGILGGILDFATGRYYRTGP